MRENEGERSVRGKWVGENGGERRIRCVRENEEEREGTERKWGDTEGK